MGTLSGDEMRALLATFQTLDSLQNLKADPEIRVQARRDRFVVRTGQNKFFLQDVRNMSEPAYVLTLDEVMAEFDGSAAAKRAILSPSAEPLSGRIGGDTVPPMPVETAALSVESPRRPWALLAVVLLLGGYIGYAEWSASRGGDEPAVVPLTKTERLAEDAALTGVYTTGSEPGQHGIVILGDGKLKLFQNNAQAAPGVVYGSYQWGRVAAQLCLVTDQPGGLIKVVGREAVEFCGEIYKRVP